jgi:hypothetical protein
MLILYWFLSVGISSSVPVNVSAVGPGKQNDFRHPDFFAFGGGEFSLDVSRRRAALLLLLGPVWLLVVEKCQCIF